MVSKTYTLYMHKNKTNGKVYIGITSQKPEHRWRNGNGYRGMMFMNAIKKYGWDNFEHLILHEGLTRELNLQHTHISRCLRGLSRKHKGYTFKYKESD